MVDCDGADGDDIAYVIMQRQQNEADRKPRTPAAYLLRHPFYSPSIRPEIRDTVPRTKTLRNPLE